MLKVVCVVSFLQALLRFVEGAAQVEAAYVDEGGIPSDVEELSIVSLVHRVLYSQIRKSLAVSNLAVRQVRQNINPILESLKYTSPTQN